MRLNMDLSFCSPLVERQPGSLNVRAALDLTLYWQRSAGFSP